MTRVELHDRERGTDVAFIGRHLYSTARLDYAAYLTRREQIAIYDLNMERLSIYEDFDDVVRDFDGTILGGRRFPHAAAPSRQPDPPTWPSARCSPTSCRL